MKAYILTNEMGNVEVYDSPLTEMKVTVGGTYKGKFKCYHNIIEIPIGIKYRHVILEVSFNADLMSWDGDDMYTSEIKVVRRVTIPDIIKQTEMKTMYRCPDGFTDLTHITLFYQEGEDHTYMDIYANMITQHIFCKYVDPYFPEDTTETDVTDLFKGLLKGDR